jgi:hypothetical protein
MSHLTHVFVQRAIINDDLGKVLADVSKVRQSIWLVAIARDMLAWHADNIVDLARWQRREGDLVPPSHLRSTH